MDSTIEQGRQLLKSNWRRLEGRQSDQNRGISIPEIQNPIPPDAVIVDLVPMEELPESKKTICTALAERRSHRKFKGAAISLAELSLLLWATQGVRRATQHYSMRTVPSAGARHSFETYLYCDRVGDLGKGLYRYMPIEHKLCEISRREDLADRIDRGLHGQRWNSAVTFLWTVVPYRMEWRYSVVAHKLIALDAGHLCQNLYLACSCIECGTCALGAYDQEMLDAVLGVDGNDEFVVYAAVAGKI